MHTDLLIIGGGAAGLFAAASAIIAAKRESINLSVIVAEKMEKCGKKIGITGKGRCNLTNTKPWQEFSTHIFPNNRFLKNSFYAMSNVDTMECFEKLGLKLVTERGDRVFPQSMRANDVTNTLVNFIKLNKGVILTNCTIDNIQKDTNFIAITNDGQTIESKKLIVATGGLSYPTTGSTGDGYEIAKRFGHSVTTLFPSLTALIPFGYNPEFHGISLKHIRLSLIINGKEVESEFGDMDFTNDGIEGPIGFKISRVAVYNLINGQKVSVSLDMKPAVELSKLQTRIKRELNNGKDLNSVLTGMLPNSLIKPFKRLQSPITNENLALKLKEWNFPIETYVGYRRAVITAGGVELKEISQKTLESKIVDGLYFAGEILNLDADTGGYNLQIAFSTGAMAANSAVMSLLTTK